MMIHLSALSVLLLIATPASSIAQLLEAANQPLVYSHHHLNVTSIDAHRKFWIEGLGGNLATFKTLQVVKFPNLLVHMTPKSPTGGTEGTTVDHVAFDVRDLRAVIERLRAAGYSDVVEQTATGLGGDARTGKTDDRSARVDTRGPIAFVNGPDRIKVELRENARLLVPITFHHVHFLTQNVDAMRAWYTATFGLRAAIHDHEAAIDLPAGSLTYSKSPTQPSGTKGRALDHIGFEANNLKELTERLERLGVVFDRPLTMNVQAGVAYTFVSDPWGTYIELTEGLDQIR